MKSVEINFIGIRGLLVPVTITTTIATNMTTKHSEIAQHKDVRLSMNTYHFATDPPRMIISSELVSPEN